jgi:hypothetical protein
VVGKRHDEEDFFDMANLSPDLAVRVAELTKRLRDLGTQRR